jgi:hypothetical protein
LTRRSRNRSATLLALPLAILACATQPNFSYFDQSDSGEGATPAPDGSVLPDAFAADSTVSDDSSASSDDASDRGPTSGDGGSGNGATDGALDAPAESGCGPVDNVSNCGACGVACDITHSNDAACTLGGGAGTCTYASCATGFADCDASAPNANGCDTPITTLDNCGACGVACNTANSVDAGCAPTGCTYSCAPGFSYCDAAPPNANGCATSLATLDNCGACGIACNTANSVDAGCGPAGCSYACATNFANCNTTSAPANTGGCECNTSACCATTGATPGVGGPGYACETTHANGVGQAFYDCEPAGTYNVTHATEACNAYLASLSAPTSACGTAACDVTISGVVHSIPYDAIIYLNTTTDTGYVWVYAATFGTAAGTVYPAATFCSGHPGGVSWQ